MRKFFESIVQSLKFGGVLRTLHIALHRTFPGPILTINVAVAVETNLPAILEDWKDEPRNDALVHRWGSKDDLDQLTMGGLSRKRVLAAFDDGERAVVTTKNGEPVGYFWVFPNAKTYDGWWRVNLEPDEIVSWHVYVAPEYRGERWFREARRFAFPQLIDEGFKCMLGFIDALNRSSRRAGASSRRKEVGRLNIFRLLGLTIYRLAPRWGAGFWSERRPCQFQSAEFRNLRSQ